MGSLFSSYFRRKDVDVLIGEMKDGERLHRRLGPVALTGLGVGATIGTGLYVQTGFVAKEFAGPSLVLSFLLAAIGCGFAALCYSELASMVPVAGSAYTYAYATLGELIAWIIGWDLILEYAIGSSVVAAGWSNYLDAFLRNVFHIHLDPRIQSAPWDFDLDRGKFFLKTVTLANGQTVMAWFNLPAILITAAVTVVLVIGIKESAGFNAVMVLLNIAVILTVVGIGAAYFDPKNWQPFLHADKKWNGVAEGAGRIFFAYIGFDSISTHAEEAPPPARPGDRNSRIALDLHRPLRCRRGGFDGDGPLSPDRHQCAAGCCPPRSRTDLRRRPGHSGHRRRHDQLAFGRQLEPTAHFASDGPRRPAAAERFCRDPPAVQDTVVGHDRRRRGGRWRGGSGTIGFFGRSGQHRDVVRVCDRLGSRDDLADHRPGDSSPVPCALAASGCKSGNLG